MNTNIYRVGGNIRFLIKELITGHIMIRGFSQWDFAGDRLDQYFYIDLVDRSTWSTTNY
jgi:hypothetical protein